MLYAVLERVRRAAYRMSEHLCTIIFLSIWLFTALLTLVILAVAADDDTVHFNVDYAVGPEGSEGSVKISIPYVGAYIQIQNQTFLTYMAEHIYNPITGRFTESKSINQTPEIVVVPGQLVCDGLKKTNAINASTNASTNASIDVANKTVLLYGSSECALFSQARDCANAGAKAIIVSREYLLESKVEVDEKPNSHPWFPFTIPVMAIEDRQFMVLKNYSGSRVRRLPEKPKNTTQYHNYLVYGLPVLMSLWAFVVAAQIIILCYCNKPIKRPIAPFETEKLAKRTYDDTPGLYNQTQCIFCYEDYTKDSILCTGPCGHDFHQSCVKDWAKSTDTSRARQGKCPLCARNWFSP